MKGSTLPLSEPLQEKKREVVPPPSFRDKDSYQELFTPLPKPDPLPTFTPFKIEAKSWRQLQDEREKMVSQEVEKTRQEAMSLWDRAKQDDSRRVNMITTEKERIMNEQRMREEIMSRGNEERIAMDKARKEEIKRQEELLSGRKIRAKTADSKLEPGYLGAGIQVYHYKDPVVEQIVQHTKKEEIRRRMSHGEVLRGVEIGDVRGVGEGRGLGEVRKVWPGRVNMSDVVTNNSHESENNSTAENSKEFFKSNVMLRSQSSSNSSTASR